jgi:hypothetical protein
MDKLFEMPDLSHLTPDEVYEKYKNKEIKKSVAVALLRGKIIKSKNGKDLYRIFDLYKLFEFNPEQHYYLVSFLSEHKNECIREKAYRIMIQEYFERCKDSLKYSVINKNKFRVICAIYTELSKKNTRDAQKLIDILEKRFSWKHASLYDVNSKEAMGLGIIELIFEGFGFVTEPCAPHECCINFTSKNGHVVSLLANEASIPLLEILSLFLELKSLYFEMGSLEEIDSFGNLKNLKHLEITYSNISEIKNLENLTNLKELILNGNKIKTIKGLEKLVNLEKLELDENQINKIENLGNLKNLKILSLSENNITEIKGLEKNSDLEILELPGNSIKEINGLSSLTELRELNLSYNRISEIKGLENLSKLKILSLRNNLISEIKNIENLNELEKINLEDNKIPERVMKEIKNPGDAQDYVVYSRYKGFRKLDYWK